MRKDSGDRGVYMDEMGPSLTINGYKKKFGRKVEKSG